jgi:UDP-N-acetylmuramate--alanine ligase
MNRTAGAELGKVHFVGIGGAGMSGIARILLARGVPVSGSDARESATSAALRAAGATVHIGHDAANVAGVDTWSSRPRSGTPTPRWSRRTGSGCGCCAGPPRWPR